jgi:hypothetical protein
MDAKLNFHENIYIYIYIWFMHRPPYKIMATSLIFIYLCYFFFFIKIYLCYLVVAYIKYIIIVLVFLQLCQHPHAMNYFYLFIYKAPIHGGYNSWKSCPLDGCGPCKKLC